MKLARIIPFCISLLMACSLQVWAQSSPAEAFTGVTIHTADGKTIKKATIVWRNGLITDVGRNVDIPFDAYVRDGGDSLHVYPGFIDGMAQWGSPDVPDDPDTPERPGDPPYARAGIQPQRKPARQLEASADALTEAPKHGFTTAALGLKGQMLPGQVSLYFIQAAQTKDHLLEPGIGLLAQFEEAQGSAYPSTTMGVMAEYRQLFDDAKALQQQERYFASTLSNYPAPQKNPVLEALYPVMDQQKPLYFAVDSKENIQRMFWLQDELGFKAVVVSGKEACQQADELKKRGIPVLASIALPEEPGWKADQDEEQEKAEKEQLTDEMKAFRQRQLEAYKKDIRNISQLIKAGVRVGYASNGLKLKNIRKNLEVLRKEGELSDQQLLQMLTQSTADILGYGTKLGDLKKGRIACFTVFTKPFMDEKALARYSITDGKITEFEPESPKQ